MILAEKIMEERKRNGWSETRVVAVFAIVTALLCMLALLGL